MFFVPSACLQLMNAHPEKTFIRNKAAQVFALTFVMEYLTLWPKFFFDILSLVGLNPHGVDIYLRTLMAIDAEVVDRDILHSPEVRCSPPPPPPHRLPVGPAVYRGIKRVSGRRTEGLWDVGLTQMVEIRLINDKTN